MIMPNDFERFNTIELKRLMIVYFIPVVKMDSFDIHVPSFLPEIVNTLRNVRSEVVTALMF